MPRLPQPGGDDGTWGDVLNDFLSQAHKTDGNLKDGVVTSSQIALGAVTNTALAANAVTATNIADGTIIESLLSPDVQTKLNATSTNTGGPLSPPALAAIQGYWLIASDTPPTQTAMYNVPVYWLKPTGILTNIPALPIAPVWNDTNTYVDIPTDVTGVEYQDGTGNVLSQGTRVPGTPGTTMTIKAVALPGYSLSATYNWTHTFTDVSTFTLVASEAFSGAAAASLVGRNLDNAVPGATGGQSLQWYAPGPGINPRWNGANSGHLYSQGLTGHAIDGSGGYGYIPVGQPPIINTPTVSGGGSLAAGTYYYTVTALVTTPGGETGVNNPVAATVASAGSSVALSWNAFPGATGYNLYRNTTGDANYGGKLLAANIQATTYSDTGSATLGTITPPWRGDNIGTVNTIGTNAGSKVQRLIWDVQNYTPGSNDQISVYVLGKHTDMWNLGVQNTFKQAASSNILGTISNSSVTTPVPGTTMNGTWQLTVLVDGTMTVITPDGTETSTTILPSFITSTAGTWVAITVESASQWTASSARVKNLRIYKA